MQFHPDKSQERIDWKFIFISHSHSSPVKLEIFEVFFNLGREKICDEREVCRDKRGIETFQKTVMDEIRDK